MLRSDNWTHEEDLILQQTMIEYAKKGLKKEDGFVEASERLNRKRTNGACSSRWYILLQKLPNIYKGQLNGNYDEKLVLNDFIMDSLAQILDILLEKYGPSQPKETEPKEPLRRMTLHLPEDLHKKLKLISAATGIKLLEIGEEMVRDFINKHERNATDITDKKAE